MSSEFIAKESKLWADALFGGDAVFPHTRGKFGLLAWLTLVVTINAHSQSFQAGADQFVTSFSCLFCET